MRFCTCGLVAALLVSCKPADPRNPDAWIARLSDSDPRERVKAIRELRNLHAQQAAPRIAELLKDRFTREEAATALTDLGTKDEVPALLEAVDTTIGAGSDQATRAATRTNARIAEALGRIGDPRAGPTLLRLARSKDEYVRIQAVQALGAIREKSAVPELSRIIDDETSPPVLVKRAVAALGEIGDPAAIPALQHALVLERRGVSLLPEASYALFLFGSQAVEPMIKIARDEDPDYLAWARDANRAQAGTYAKAALVLGDLGDPRAIPVLLDLLKYKDPDPNPPTARLLTNLVRQFAAGALGRLRATQATGAILALIETKDAQDADLVDAASDALVWIGDRAVARELFKRAASGNIRERVKAAEAGSLLGDGALQSEAMSLSQRALREPVSVCQKQVQELGLESEPGRACEAIGAQFAAFSGPLEAQKRCGANAACWRDNLANPSALLRARSAYELGRLEVAPAVPALVRAATDPDLVARVAAIRALERLIAVPAARGDLKAAVDPLAGQLQAEQGRAQFVRVDEELRRLQVRLARL
ncbi:MAG: HEAT repeat domain-containing protein [Myxococcales bacterium]